MHFFHASLIMANLFYITGQCSKFIGFSFSGPNVPNVVNTSMFYNPGDTVLVTCNLNEHIWDTSNGTDFGQSQILSTCGSGGSWSPNRLTCGPTQTQINQCTKINKALPSSVKKKYVSSLSAACYYLTPKATDWTSAAQSCENTGIAQGVKGRLAWITTSNIWNDLMPIFWSTKNVWIGLKSQTGSNTRPDLYWYDNSTTPALQLTFGSDSMSGQLTNVYQSGNDCYKVAKWWPTPQWGSETCSKNHQALCELVCDNEAAIPPRKFTVVTIISCTL